MEKLTGYDLDELKNIPFEKLLTKKSFDKAMKLTGIALTKYDGTSKGGIIFNLKYNLQLPVKLLGVGEGIEDLLPFKAVPFVKAFFEE